MVLYGNEAIITASQMLAINNPKNPLEHTPAGFYANRRIWIITRPNDEQPFLSAERRIEPVLCPATQYVSCDISVRDYSKEKKLCIDRDIAACRRMAQA